MLWNYFQIVPVLACQEMPGTTQERPATCQGAPRTALRLWVCQGALLGRWTAGLGLIPAGELHVMSYTVNMPFSTRVLTPAVTSPRSGTCHGSPVVPTALVVAVVALMRPWPPLWAWGAEDWGSRPRYDPCAAFTHPTSENPANAGRSCPHPKQAGCQVWRPGDVASPHTGSSNPTSDAITPWGAEDWPIYVMV